MRVIVALQRQVDRLSERVDDLRSRISSLEQEHHAERMRRIGEMQIFTKRARGARGPLKRPFSSSLRIVFLFATLGIVFL